MGKILRAVLILIVVVIMILAGTFKLYFINGRFYAEKRWTRNYKISTVEARKYNTVVMVGSSCNNTGHIKISGYVNNEGLFDYDFAVGGEKSTDITVYRNLKPGENDLVIKIGNGLEAHKKIEIGKGQKLVYVTYLEDKNTRGRIVIKVIDRPGVI